MSREGFEEGRASDGWGIDGRPEEATRDFGALFAHVRATEVPVVEEAVAAG